MWSLMHIWEVLMTSQKIHGSCVQLKPCSAIIILPPCSEVLHDVALIWQQLNRVSCCKGLLLPFAFSALSGDTEVFAMPARSLCEHSPGLRRQLFCLSLPSLRLACKFTWPFNSVSTQAMSCAHRLLFVLWKGVFLGSFLWDAEFSRAQNNRLHLAGLHRPFYIM